MKHSLGPVWTPAQIAAGKRFGQQWFDFFARTGGDSPALPRALRNDMASVTAVRVNHEARLLRYPNVVGVTEGTRMRAGRLTGEPALIVLVSGKVPRAKLPKGSLLPAELDGVPIDVIEVGPIEALSAPAAGRATAPSRRPRRRKREAAPRPKKR
jgi:hypothetical protein